MNRKIWFFVIASLLLLQTVCGVPYVVDVDDVNGFGEKLGDIEEYEKRGGCIRRSGSCDHRPNDCCFSSACRCNLWGTNCRCQRAGLFQRWGRK